ncbi:hypothetical protein ACQVBX_02805 [Dyella sp. KULCS107]|uniref:hypothetical protein n=1 Tax=Dyella sp. KULCS107 TaxID=3422216 RepID=UPI003D6F8401
MRLSERRKWQRTREKGVLQYVLVNGVLLFSFPMFLFVTFVLKHDRLPIWESAVLWSVTGIVYRGATWVINERRYRKALAEPLG